MSYEMLQMQRQGLLQRIRASSTRQIVGSNRVRSRSCQGRRAIRWVHVPATSRPSTRARSPTPSKVKANFCSGGASQTNARTTSPYDGLNTAELTLPEVIVNITEDSPYRLVRLRSIDAQDAWRGDLARRRCVHATTTRTFGIQAPTNVFDLDDPTTWPPRYQVDAVHQQEISPGPDRAAIRASSPARCREHWRRERRVGAFDRHVCADGERPELARQLQGDDPARPSSRPEVHRQLHHPVVGLDELQPATTRTARRPTTRRTTSSASTGGSLLQVSTAGPSTIDDVEARLRERRYIGDRALATAIYLALKLEKPLFIEGEAGVGKTEAAKVMADVLGARLIRLQCYEGIDLAHAVYEWNYPRQLLHIRLLNESEDRRAGRARDLQPRVPAAAAAAGRDRQQRQDAPGPADRRDRPVGRGVRGVPARAAVRLPGLDS